MTVRRGDGEVTLTVVADRKEIINKHVIQEAATPTREQLTFRKRWLEKS